MRGALFDLDGTLVDTLEDIASAMNHVLAAHGLPVHSRDAYRLRVGEGAAALVEAALPPAERGSRDAYLAEFRARYADHLLVASAPYPGVPELLAALAARGVRLAVLSNKPDAFTRAIVASLFADVAFRSVVGQRPELPRKPDPTSALAIAAELGVAPGECLFVGDSGIDMRTAEAAGMIGVGVLWGFRDEAELREHGARVVVGTAAEVLELVSGTGTGTGTG